MADPGLLLPPGAVLLHVGPYKTGTTALQASFEQHRDELREHGVLYPGTRRRHARPVFALLGHALPGMPDVPEQEWDDLADEVRRARDARVVLSSEDFASLAPDQAARAVADLGADRVHVLMVARNLSGLLPSAWQERVKSVNETKGYHEFLAEVLAEQPEGASAAVFWRHHSLAALIRLWTDVLPPQRMTVVVADDSDRAQLRRVCERLLGLPEHVLTEAPAGNPSLSWNRAELYRALNRTAADRHWDAQRYRRLVYRGLLAGLVATEPAPDESPIPSLPAWAVRRVAELGEQRVSELADSGVRVVGEVSRLLAPATDDVSGEDHPPTSVPIEAAVHGLEALVEALRRERSHRDARPRRLR
ncbi:MAG: hypothetical protein WB797_00885 [Nocardioides sp.]